jgi:hypothetical protein
MDWLSELGKDNKRIEVVHRYKNGKVKNLTKEALNLREYKQQYYINNIGKYTERNRKASQERTIARIRNLMDDVIIDAINIKLDE